MCNLYLFLLYLIKKSVFKKFMLSTFNAKTLSPRLEVGYNNPTSSVVLRRYCCNIWF